MDLDDAPVLVFRGVEHSEAEWEALREVFTKLYRDEGKTLPQVALELRQTRGFEAK
jgi:hypothetical protein